MAKDITDKHTVGSALAVTNMFVMLAGVIQPITGLLLRYVGIKQMVNGAPVYSIPAYHLALSIIPLSLMATMLMIGFVRETYKPKD